MAEPLRKPGDETDPTLASICDGLVRHLKGEGTTDRYSRTYQLLAKHLLERLPPGEAERLRRSPEAGRGVLTDLLAARLRDDARTRQLAAVILTPAGQVSRGLRREDKTPRILFLSALPEKMGTRPLPRLEIDREIRQVQDALRRTPFEVFARSAVRARDLSWCLLEYDPDILHFSGHGYQGALMIEQDDGTDWLLEGRHLAELFGIFKNRLRCVVLNACFSGLQAEPIAQVVGAAVAHDEAVEDTAARLFSEQFYEGLGYGRTLREAYELGCWRVKTDEACGMSALPQLLGEAREIRFVNAAES